MNVLDLMALERAYNRYLKQRGREGISSRAMAMRDFVGFLGFQKFMYDFLGSFE